MALAWFKSYLTDRKQLVSLNGVESNMKLIYCGVPQGSVIGPLLFLLYINDLPNISKHLKFFLFADDTNIYYVANDLKNLEKKINKELQRQYEWLCINRLTLNISQINFMICHAINKPKVPVAILINKFSIEEAKYVKYLIDPQLSFKFHIDELSKRVSRSIGILFKLMTLCYYKKIIKYVLCNYLSLPSLWYY